MSYVPHILAVDDNRGNLEILRRLLSEQFDVKGVASGEEALDVAPRYLPEVVLMDIRMPGMDGIEACRRIHDTQELRDAKILMLSASSEIADRLAAYDAGAVDYITKPFHGAEVLAKVQTWMRMAQRRNVNQVWCDMEAVRDGIGRTLTSLVELRDTETGEHLIRMRWYSQVLAEQLAQSGPYRRVIDDQFLYRLQRASPLHDIGKIGIDDAILRKPVALSPEEFEILKTHTVIGADLLARAAKNLPYADYLTMAVKIARSHHERFNGTGYPDGLVGEQIPLSARIVTVADVFDAVTADRVYRKSLSTQQALDIIAHGSGSMFDPAVVEAFESRRDQIIEGRNRFSRLEGHELVPSNDSFALSVQSDDSAK